MSRNTQPRKPKIKLLPAVPELSASTLRVAHECIGKMPAVNAKQAVELANALVEIEAYANAMFGGGVQVEQEVKGEE